MLHTADVAGLVFVQSSINDLEKQIISDPFILMHLILYIGNASKLIQPSQAHTLHLSLGSGLITFLEE